MSVKEIYLFIYLFLTFSDNVINSFLFEENHNLKREPLNGAVPKVMSVALIELVEMTATLNVVVSINSTTVMQTYWTAPDWSAFSCSTFK